MPTSPNSDIPQLLRTLQAEGTNTQELTEWRSRSLAAFLIATESGAYYIIEPIPEQPCLVSRISDIPPSYGEYRLPALEPIVRRQGNPDSSISTGESVDIYGLSRKNTEFDPDSIYTTTPVTEIRYLESKN